jgi:hypothetical protein
MMRKSTFLFPGGFKGTEMSRSYAGTILPFIENRSNPAGICCISGLFDIRRTGTKVASSADT